MSALNPGVVSNTEMDRRIRALVEQVGNGGMTVRHDPSILAEAKNLKPSKRPRRYTKAHRSVR